MKVEINEKDKPADMVLAITSATLEEKIFLSSLYDRRSVPHALKTNVDGTVTIEYTY